MKLVISCGIDELVDRLMRLCIELGDEAKIVEAVLWERL